MPTTRKPARPTPYRPAYARPPQAPAPAEGTTLFVREFPAALARKARALASLRGVNVREIIAEALRDYLAQAPDWRGDP